MSKKNEADGGMLKVTKTELVWPGKYNDDGTLREVPRINLPFQVIETINESRATREAVKKGQQQSLFDVWEGKEGDSFEDGWKNKLIWGDNLLVMGSLLEKFAGKVDLIYIDPPFATGSDFCFATKVGDGNVELEKQQSIIEEKAYRDTWGAGSSSYLSMMWNRLQLIRDLLSDRGTVYVHLDYRFGHPVKLLMDQLFGGDSFMNEIAWHYRRWPSRSANFQRQHDKILVYAKNYGRHLFVPLLMPLTEGTNRRWQGQKSKVEYIDGIRQVTQMTDEASEGTPMDDVWNIPVVNSQAKERVDYATQKPEELLERVLQASASPGGLVADFFCGSGTTLAVAEKLGLRWIGSDLSRWGLHTTRKRMLSIEDCRPFEILNLGQYERKYWQGVTFGEKEKKAEQQAIFQYIAFILKLYGAKPLAGMEHIHGQIGKALVHVGAVDAPVTIDEANACIAECLNIKQKELHILGWEWEMGMNDLIVQEAKRRDVKLLMLNIPREVMEQQAVDKGDIRFFEVAHLEFKTSKTKDRKVTIKLEDFAFPYADLIPKDVKKKIKKWSDYIDYWAIDWDFQNDTFMNGWVAYRTRKERKLALTSDPHAYDKAGKYTVMVKVVDIFGNDTSKTAEVEVK